MSTRREKIKVYEMTCTSCEHRVEKAIKKLDGIISVKANYSGEFAIVEYEENLCTLSQIKASIKKAGYGTEKSNDYKFIGTVIIVAAIAFLGVRTSGFDMDSKLANASYTVLFLVGILTSIHCVGMCGGIMLSQSIKNDSESKFDAIKPALLYNMGRVASYTILGGIIGALGSIFSLSITAKAMMQIIAGAFMIMMGFNMAGFKFFRSFQIKLPHTACKIKNKSGSPFIVGLLNGLMPCGPLQTMQLFALGTGSAFKGALSMLIFSLGTVPLMLTFGALSGLLSKGYTKKILKLSGVLIIVLGLIMGNRGFILAGININPLTALSGGTATLLGGSSKDSSNSNVAKATIKDGVQTINMTANTNGYTPNAFYVQKGIPVKWVIDGKELNSCNNSVVAQSLNVEKKLKSGENVIEFTPGDKDINFSCWMGMIRGVIKVVDKLDTVDTSKSDPSLPPPSTGPSCCAGPVTDGSAAQSSSIYGNDLTKVPTETLINKASGTGKNLSAKFNGIGYELKPAILVTSSNSTTKLTFDMTKFDNPEGTYEILDTVTGKKLSEFTFKKGINVVEFVPNATTSYAILKDNQFIGIIEVVDDLKNKNLEEIRSKYFN
ncbi:sulfite exporter TauE/SafE family protein [Clostridium folliculivorans]|uniref:Heavy metal-associated domain-containing protein n=1 Tax=Clostridium folliculivorans TaxID=2886038 RepID=A0A9W5Y149_9CLOT|nr:sulfite exporter TauE/SafE family protein [Clostridium folliculivorans]GKU24562.1 heavy metal-associated domain-containing protein [Clostridium folliculivorans]GKU30660.1 heavy metal-associated domain-containing protein [Clostridium folliculivorans]